MLLVGYDVVALQEIRSVDVAAAFGDVLPAAEYGVVQLAPTGTSARQEATCFVYRRAAVRYVAGGLIRTTRAVYAPARAVFEVVGSSERFTVVSVHVSPSVSVAGRQRDIAALAAALPSLDRYARTTDDVDELLVVGDFNVEPDAACFRSWRRTHGLHAALPATASTTLGARPRTYDHVWARTTSEHVVWASARVVSYDDLVDRRHAASRAGFRASVSDHLPVVVALEYPIDVPGVGVTPVAAATATTTTTSRQ
jgi:endonuclease/exonuclease/phosphatase family metal-dependent hydrolase